MNRLLTKPFLLVALAGFIFGSITGIALCNDDGSRLLLYATLLGAAGLVCLLAAWLLSSAALARVSRLPGEESRKLACWPFASAAFLPILYLPFALSGISENSFLRPLSPGYQVAIVTITSAGLVFSLLALRFPALQRGPLSWMTNRPALSLAIIILAWTALFGTLDILKTVYFTKNGYNTAFFMDVLRHVSSENGPLFSGMGMAEGTSMLGVHSAFIWYLVYPIFCIWPSPEWLLIISNFAIALATIPLYLLARRFFGKGISLLIIAAFLFNRVVVAQPAVTDMSVERFLPVLLISAIYFWQKRSFWPFMVFSFLSMLVREDIAIIIALWGLVSLFQRRPLRWSLAPLLLGLSWFALMMTWLIPAFNPLDDSTFRGALRYSALGEDSGDIIHTLLFEPWVAIKLAFGDLRHLAYWYGLWESFGFGLPLLTPTVVLSLPALTQSVLLSQPSLSMFNNLILAATLFPAFVLGLAKAESFARKRWRRSVAPTLVLLTLFSALALTYSWFSPSWYQPRYNYDQIKQVYDLIPAGASVMLPDFMAAGARPDQQVTGYHQATYRDMLGIDLLPQEDYVVITQTIPIHWGDSSFNRGRTLLQQEVESSGEYSLLYEGGDLQLYARNGP